MNSYLTQIPGELQYTILGYVATGTALEQISDLTSISQTCHNLNHAVFCAQNDLLWRPCAHELGIPEEIGLEDVQYPGSSTLNKRRWLNVVKLNFRWLHSFKSKKFELHKAQNVLRSQKRKNTNEKDDFLLSSRRTIEMVVGGKGTSNDLTCRPEKCLSSNQGRNTTFQVREGRNDITGILDLTLNCTQIIGSQPAETPDWGEALVPCSAGYFKERTPLGLLVHECNENGSGRTWNLGQRSVKRFISKGEILVGSAFPRPAHPRNNIASTFMCVQSTLDKGTVSSVAWEIDIPEEWRDRECPNPNRYRYTHLKNFHMTSSNIVCLITRHPDEMLGKLTRTEFVVLSIKSGDILRRFEIKEATKDDTDISQRYAFTTAFKHDFVLTDTFIVSGGLGGGLYVWDYSAKAENHLLYRISDPLMDPVGPIKNLYPNQYSDLSMSVDGHYLGVTSADKLLILDMVQNKTHSAYTNGYIPEQPDCLSNSPVEVLPAGMWCWIKEWAPSKNCHSKDDDIHWEVTSSRVAYLTAMLDNNMIVTSGSTSWVYKYLWPIIPLFLSFLAWKTSSSYAFRSAILIILCLYVYFKKSMFVNLYRFW